MRALVAWALLAAIWSLGAATSPAATVVVDCAGTGFTAIQEAVNAAATGDTILIAPCVYEEQVSATDKALTLIGSGAEATELLWSGQGAALDINMPNWGTFSVDGLRITRVPDTDPGLLWDDHTVVLRNCIIEGSVVGGRYYGEAHVDDCTITRLGVTGGVRQTVIRDSRIGRMGISGIQFQAGNSLASERTRYGLLDLGCMVSAHSSEDSIGRAVVPGGLDCGSVFEAEDSVIDTLLGTRSASVELDRCVTGDITCTYLWEDEFVPLSLRYCIIEGDVVVQPEWGARRGAGGRTRQSREFWGMRILHNTITGDLLHPMEVPIALPSDEYCVRANVVLGRTQLYGGDLLISHNDFVGGFEATTPGDSVFANFSEDPLFCCPASGDYTLQDCSPCLGGAHDGGDIGGLGVGCVCDVPVEHQSWGAIKRLFE